MTLPHHLSPVEFFFALLLAIAAGTPDGRRGPPWRWRAARVCDLFGGAGFDWPRAARWAEGGPRE
jgi:hypothetical protein